MPAVISVFFVGAFLVVEPVEVGEKSIEIVFASVVAMIKVYASVGCFGAVICTAALHASRTNGSLTFRAVIVRGSASGLEVR